MFYLFLALFAIFILFWSFFAFSVLYHLRKYSLPGWSASRFVVPSFFIISALFFLIAVYFFANIPFSELNTLL